LSDLYCDSSFNFQSNARQQVQYNTDYLFQGRVIYTEKWHWLKRRWNGWNKQKWKNILNSASIS